MKYSAETKDPEKGEMAAVEPRASVVNFPSSLNQKIFTEFPLGMVSGRGLDVVRHIKLRNRRGFYPQETSNLTHDKGHTYKTSRDWIIMVN